MRKMLTPAEGGVFWISLDDLCNYFTAVSSVEPANRTLLFRIRNVCRIRKVKVYIKTLICVQRLCRIEIIPVIQVSD